MNDLSENTQNNTDEFDAKEFFTKPFNIVMLSIPFIVLIIMAIFSPSGDVIDSGNVPNVIEENVETAIEEMNDEGFSNIIVETNTDENHTDSWIVCAQDPKSPMETNKKEEITLYVAENCRSMDSDGNIIEVVEVMPDVVGKTLAEARNEISDNIEFYNIDITENDATELDRSVWSAGNWIVCNQSIEPEYEITSNSDLQLDYARDADECEGKTKPVERLEVEATADGLTEAGAEVKCNEWIFRNHPDLKIRWALGRRYTGIVEEYDGLGEMWQFNVDVKKSGDTVGTLICKVGGTEDSPFLVDAFINSR